MKTRLLLALAVLLVIAAWLFRASGIGGSKADASPGAPRYGKSTVQRISGDDAEPGRREKRSHPRNIPGMRGELPPREELIASGLRASLDRSYGDFFAMLQLSGEELEYFKDLLTQRMASDRDLTLRWLNAPAAEKERLLRQINERQPGNTEAISRFLNHPDDLAAFLVYERQIPERQSLNGYTLAGPQREKLIGIIHGLRIESGEEASSRLAGLDSIIRTGNTDEIQQRWRTADQKLPDLLTGIFTETETNDFLKHWALVRENQLREFEATLRHLDQGSRGSE